MSRSSNRKSLNLERVFLFVLFLWFMILAILTLPSGAQAAGRNIYVASGGNDNNSGTIDKPLRTIQAGVSGATAGDTVFVRGGTYVETVRILQSGSSENPITVKAYPGEMPVIDGRAGVDCLNCGLPDVPIVANQIDPITGRGFNYNPLVSIEGDHIIFEGFTVKQSMGRGIRVWRGDSRASYVTLRNNRVLDSRDVGIILQTTENILVEDNVIRHSSNFAPWVDGRDSSVDWSGGLVVKNGNNILLRKNTVYENWGEGILVDANTGSSTNITVEDNVVYDNFALQIYVHRAGNMTVQRNITYHTNNQEFRRGGNPSACIVVANERQFFGSLVTNNIDIVNNIAVGCSQNFAVWGTSDGQGYNNFLVANNTFVNSVTNNDNMAMGISFDDGEYKNFNFENNIIYQGNTSGNHRVGYADSDVYYANNLWYPHHPEEGGGTSVEDIVGQEPQFVDPHAYELPEDWSQRPDKYWFKIKSSSPAIDQGGFSQPFLSSTDIILDLYFGRRDPNPDLGVHEYGSHPPKAKKSFSSIQQVS